MEGWREGETKGRREADKNGEENFPYISILVKKCGENLEKKLTKSLIWLFMR